MQLHQLPSVTEKKLKRVGRGHGSGRSKTAGRGTKGQKARRDIPLRFEGGALPITKRLPFLRGKGRNKVFKVKPVAINIEDLNVFDAKSVVDIDALVTHNIIEDEVKKVGVKILGRGTLEKQLTVKLPVSVGAKAKIEQAGGSVEVNS